MTRSTALLGFGIVLSGCGAADTGSKVDLPNIELSTEALDFGDVNWGEPQTRDIILENTGGSPVGIGEISLTLDSYENNFQVLYDFTEETCEGDAAEARRADAKGVGTNGTKDTSDTGFYTGDTGDTGAGAVVEQVLDPGCQIPIHVIMDPISLGEVKAGLLILTMDEPTDQELTYFRDPDEEYKIVILSANAVDEHGRIYVDPKRLDFGFVWAGVTAVRYVTVHNVGQGDLNLTDYVFNDSCVKQFSITGGFDTASGQLLEPGDSTSLEISYLPLDANDVTATECVLKIHSDDPDQGEVEVQIRANQPGLAIDTPPVVNLISPPPGTIVNAANLTVELDMWDANQPASSLDCYIRSAHLKMTKIAECIPTDESGHVIVQIPAADSFDPGTDTLEVLVTDAHGQKSIATTTILYLTPAPANDDDGDGYVDQNVGGDDCDDNDNTVYPEGAELPDGKDNNCEPTCVLVDCSIPGAPGGGVQYQSCIDEGTILGDDDHDCYIEQVGPPNGGDCNDMRDDTYPKAAELPDSADNDCDGLIDEDTTSSDDDGDGYDELNGDFDDNDPTRNPGAIEYCDGIDNDCDNIIDDAGACIPTDSQPIIVGGVMASKTDIAVNESTSLTVVGFDADGDSLVYTWTQDENLGGFIAFDNASGPGITFTAPSKVFNDQDKYKYTVQVVVEDDDKNQDWAYGYVWVHGDTVSMTRTVGGDDSGCKNGSNALVLPFPILALALARRRRRAERAA